MKRFIDLLVSRYQKKGYAYLATVPEIKRFLGSRLFESITLVADRYICEIIRLEFDVIAPSLMPHPRARLLEHGLVKRHNLLRRSETEDRIRQTIGFFGNSLQITLNFCK